jgi:predicted NAD-dependent protein-ADP-ribosyltransferase YbiA (DUF1768 family)
MGGPCVVGGDALAPLDNFHPCAFELDGRAYSSAEQYYQVG